MAKKKEKEQELEEDDEQEKHEKEKTSETEEIEESGIESDLEQAESGFQEKSFRDFFQPVQQTSQMPSVSLEALPAPEPEFTEMAQQAQGPGFGISPEEEKSAMNYDIQPLRVESKEEYHVQRPQSPETVTMPEVNVGRVDFENIGRGRMRIGSEFNFREFQNTAMQGMGMSSAHNEYEQPLEAPEDVDMTKRTVMDTQPGFKPRKDYKTR